MQDTNSNISNSNEGKLLESLIIEMIKDYQDLNPSFVESIDCTHSPPSAVDFSRYVSRNRPVVLRGYGHTLEIPALSKWTASYLREKLGKSNKLKIAATPAGNADALVDGVFVEPAYLEMDMHTFLDKLQNPDSEEVLYLQSQNDNLHGELRDLLADATQDIPIASEVFGQKPEVANVWIGDDRSTTSLHKDPYENLYLVVHGTKTFHLLPPTEFYCLHEQIFPCGEYERSSDGQWSICQTDQKTPWIPVDPVDPDLTLYPRFKHARPMSITLQRGDILYLPALWFHRVSQKAGDTAGEGTPLAVAVNWWYDLAYDSPTWTLASTVRKMALAVDGRSDEA